LLVAVVELEPVQTMEVQEHLAAAEVAPIPQFQVLEAQEYLAD
jgi:hypothetical protein